MATAGVTLWSTTAASNNSADPGINWLEGQAPSSVNDSARGMMQSIANWRNDLYGLTTGGTSTAFTVATGSSFATAAVMSGAVFTVIPHATSGAAPTLAVDGLTARALNISTGVAVPTGAMVLGTPYPVKYVHATTEFILLGNVGKNLLTAVDIIGGTQLTTIAVDDSLPIYDLSATANKRILVSDFLKVTNLLTADSSPDRAADYVMTYDASASAAKKVLLSSLPSNLPRGYIDGCTIANGTDATNDINVSAGICRDSTNTVDITVAAMSGKQLDANWVPGAAAGMRNSAAGIADTTYHIYAVSKADGTQDIYAHTSTTVATVLTALQAESGGTDYIYARRIGSIVRVSAALLAFTQRGDDFFLSSPVIDITSTNQGTSAVTHTLATVPVGLEIEAKLNCSIVPASTGSVFIYISALTAADLVPSATAAPLGTFNSITNATDHRTFQTRVFTNASAQIRSRWSASAASDVMRIAPTGWRDRRGKDS